MGDKDTVSKHLLKRLVVDLARYLFRIEIAALDVLDTEQQRVEDRRADLVVLARQGALDPFLLHVEIQNDNDARMALRMLRYRTDLMAAWPGRDVRQYLIYIGRAALAMAEGLRGTGLDYRYTAVDMHRIDCRVLLDQGSADALVLAILCDFGGRDRRAVVREILTRLRAITSESPQRFREYLEMLEILSANRDLKDCIREEETMLRVAIKELPSYALGLDDGLEQGLEQGLERGLTQGIRATLERQIERRFGPLDEASRARIAAAPRPTLETWTDRVLTAGSLAEVLDPGGQGGDAWEKPGTDHGFLFLPYRLPTVSHPPVLFTS